MGHAHLQSVKKPIIPCCDVISTGARGSELLGMAVRFGAGEGSRLERARHFHMRKYEIYYPWMRGISAVKRESRKGLGHRETF